MKESMLNNSLQSLYRLQDKENKAKSAKDLHMLKDLELLGHTTTKNMLEHLPQNDLPANWSVPQINFASFVSYDEVLIKICKNLLHVSHSQLYLRMGVKPPTGLLIHGPPGTGKTMLAEAIAGEFKWPFLKVSGTEIISSITGASEKKIRNIFKETQTLALDLNKQTPPGFANKYVVLFIDNIDVLAPKKDNVQKEMEKRVVGQLISCVDDVCQNGQNILLLASTNQIELVDPSLRRSGRFDQDIILGMPNEDSRFKLLQEFCGKFNIQGVDLNKIAKNTPGFVAADLKALVREAAIAAISRCIVKNCKLPTNPKQYSNNQQLELYLNLIKDSPGSHNIPDLTIKGEHLSHTPLTNGMDASDPLEDGPFNVIVESRDFDAALRNVVPSCKREGFFSPTLLSQEGAAGDDTDVINNINPAWDEGIGALAHLKKELTLCIRGAVKYPHLYARFGLASGAGATGVLLAGPPGCGKTLLARAIARESSLNFIAIAGPELLNMYVGETERAIRRCFGRAKDSAPCIIFFDEIDSICPHRVAAHQDASSENSSSRIVNQLLTEMDGIDSRQMVFVMGATNRIDVIDKAILRPGRFDKIFYVNLPNAQERSEILRVLTNTSSNGGLNKEAKCANKTPLYSPDIDFESIANDPRCDGFSGADLAALVKEASRQALKWIVEYKESLENCDEKKSCKRIKFSDGESITANREAEINNMIENPVIKYEHFETALNLVKPSVTLEERKRYQKMALKH